MDTYGHSVEPTTEPQDPERFLQEAAEQAAAEPIVITIRELISHWSAKRRGYYIVQQVTRDLERHGLTTVPSFESGWIDSLVIIARIQDLPKKQDSQPVSEADQEPDTQQMSTPSANTALKVRSLQSAETELVSVNRDESLACAQSLMLKHDFSQLPVLAGKREIHGAVSWESIAKVKLHNSSATLRDCIVPTDPVYLDDDLLAHIPRIISSGYVFVKNRDRTICGIVTTADLSTQFQTLAGPFLLIGEAERRLREIVAKKFSISDLESVRDPGDSERVISGADDLTLGEYVKLFESKERWNKLEWQIDRVVFVSALTELRKLRNEIMHFSPDPIEEDRVTAVQNMLKWLKLLEV